MIGWVGFSGERTLPCIDGSISPHVVQALRTACMVRRYGLEGKLQEYGERELGELTTRKYEGQQINMNQYENKPPCLQKYSKPTSTDVVAPKNSRLVSLAGQVESVG